jgi:dihydropteroate synthase
VAIGDGLDVAVMGAINVSPESFYAGSVAAGEDELLRVADAMVEAGASFLDVGAMSTAPYLTTRISEQDEAERLGAAVRSLANKVGVPISADTSRGAPAQRALDAGARVVNDVTGLRGDAALAGIVARAGAGLVVMAAESAGMASSTSQVSHERHDVDPVAVVEDLLADSLERAADAGIPDDRIAVDPGIGFFRTSGLPWHEWDVAVLDGLERLRALGRPLLVGVSRKSFLGALTGERDPARRLPASLAATTVAVMRGAHVIRTHDVAETVQAVRVAQAARRASAARLG